MLHDMPGATCRKSENADRRDKSDAQFLKMLHSMDDASIPLEAKWDAIAKQMGSKEEFRWAAQQQSDWPCFLGSAKTLAVWCCPTRSIAGHLWHALCMSVDMSWAAWQLHPACV